MDERFLNERKVLSWLREKAPFQAPETVFQFLQFKHLRSYFTDLSAHWLELGFLYTFSEGIPDYRIVISVIHYTIEVSNMIEAKAMRKEEGFLEDGVAAVIPHSLNRCHISHVHIRIRSLDAVQQGTILVVEVEGKRCIWQCFF